MHGKCSISALLLMLTACGQETGTVSALDISDRDADAPRAQRESKAVREAVVRANRCLGLISAVVTARSTEMADAIKEAGLDGIDLESRTRWLGIAQRQEDASDLPKGEIAAIAEEFIGMKIESAEHLAIVAPEARECDASERAAERGQ